MIDAPCATYRAPGVLGNTTALALFVRVMDDVDPDCFCITVTVLQINTKCSV